MSKKIALAFCIVLMIPLVTGCGESLKFWKKKKEVEVVNKKLPPFEKLFNRSVEMYNMQQYKDAIQAFLFLRENYPRKGNYQSRITLYIADSHYKLKEYPEAIANYEEFIKLYPTSPDVPYAYFQIGMSNYNQRRTYDRDASFIRKAIKNFEKVLQIAPPGVLVNESIRMIAFCQRELSLHDFFIADFYLRTHHYKAAILRYEDILDKYPNLKVQDRAHLGIAKAYLKLKKRNKAYRHLSFVAKHYPNTPYGKEAWKLLQKDYKVASLNELPDVTFPRVIPVEYTKAASAKEKAPETRKEAVKKAPAKTEPASKTAAGKKETVKATPHIYYPPVEKTVKVKPKPVDTKASKKAAPPASTVETTKPVKTAGPVKKAAPAAPVKPAVPSEKTAPAVEPSKPEVKKPAPKPVTPPVKALETKTKEAEKPETAAPPKPEPAKAKTPPPTEAEVKKTSAEKTQPAEKAAKASEAKPVKVAKKEKKKEQSPANVKTMVKTDRLPPKKKKSSGSSLGPVGAIDTRLPIHISSDHVEAQQGKNSVRFYGNVLVTQKDVTLKCDDLTAYYAAGGKAIDRIVAHGNVSITQQNKKVTCGKAIFYNAARKIVLENSPTAWDGKNKLSGSKMVLLLEKNEIQILGSKKKPTELVIYPGSQ